MRNKIRLIGMIFMIAFTLILTSTVVKAGTINTLDVTPSASCITVSGTTESDVSAVSIEVYKEDGTTLVTMKTTSVDDNNNFSVDIELEDGTYNIKVADYSGGNYITKENVVVGPILTDDLGDETIGIISEDDENKANTDNTTSEEKKTSSNPKTGDNIMKIAAVFVVAVLGILITIKLNKKNKIVGKH